MKRAYFKPAWKDNDAPAGQSFIDAWQHKDLFLHRSDEGNWRVSHKCGLGVLNVTSFNHGISVIKYLYIINPDWSDAEQESTSIKYIAARNFIKEQNSKY